MPKVTVDNLAEVIGDILEEYGQDVANITSDAVRAVAKEGVKAVREGREGGEPAVHTPAGDDAGYDRRIGDSPVVVIGRRQIGDGGISGFNAGHAHYR